MTRTAMITPHGGPLLVAEATGTAAGGEVLPSAGDGKGARVEARAAKGESGLGFGVFIEMWL